MLDVTITKEGFKMKGHCGYAERGKDIVCASVSALYLTFLCTTNAIEKAGADERIACLTTQDRAGIIIHDAVAEGIKAIAKQYPEHVKVTTLPL